MEKRTRTMPERGNASNDHVIRIAGGILKLPLRAVGWAYNALRHTLRVMTPRKNLHVADELRKTRIRRELRGLPPDHDPSAPHPRA